MKYLYKAISTNTKDLRTGILLIFEESRYLFNAPEGLSRVAGGNQLFAK